MDTLEAGRGLDLEAAKAEKEKVATFVKWLIPFCKGKRYRLYWLLLMSKYFMGRGVEYLFGFSGSQSRFLSGSHSCAELILLSDYLRNMVTAISKKKIEFFQETILEWYKEGGRTFHWRRKGLTHYQYVIAEVLLQRTKAETIAKFYPLFLMDFPNWKALANADIQKLEYYLKPVGLYRQRSKRLMSLAKEMVKRNGRLPKDREDLVSIPFMGQYIANAVELVIFNESSPLVDVNMSRVLERFFGERKMADIRYDPYLQKLSYQIVNHKNAKEINWAVLDLSALICKPKPLCNKCMLSSKCLYFKLNKNQEK